MHMFDFYYFWYNLAPIILLLFLAYCFWKINIKNEELNMERERIIQEREQQRKSMQQALQTYERESTRFNETERKLQEILKRIERENQKLSARTIQSLNEIDEKRKHLRDEYDRQYTRRQQTQSRQNKNDDTDFQQIFENVCKVVNVIAGVGTAFMIGKAAFR